MNYLKKITGILATLIVSGCSSSSLIGVDGTDLTVNLTQSYVSGKQYPMYIIKMTPQLAGKCSRDREGVEPYIFWGTQCYFKGHIPNKIDIQYAKWKPIDQIPDNYKGHMKQFGDSLPASAWQTYTLYPKPVMAKVKQTQKPTNTPILLPKVISKKSMMIFLDIDSEGNIAVRDEAQYGYSSSLEGYH